MDVRQFVTETLAQVMQGVADAQEIARELGGYVNPTAGMHVTTGPDYFGSTADGRPIHLVEFDIALASEASSGMEGGGGVKVASILQVGGKASSGDKNSATSRVKFRVPFSLPIETDSQAARDERNQKAQAAIDAFKARRRNWIG